MPCVCVAFLSYFHATHLAAPWSVYHPQLQHLISFKYSLLNIPLLPCLPLSGDKDRRINCVMLDNPAGRYASFSQIITSSAWNMVWSKGEQEEEKSGKNRGKREKEREHVLKMTNANLHG